MDEAQPFQLTGYRIDTIASATFEQHRYFAKVEPAMETLRKTYSIPSRRAMHFTDIKLLTSAANWGNPRCAAWKPCFSDRNGNPDFGKLFSFYEDVLAIISESQAIFHATGLFVDITANPLQGLARNQRYKYSYQLMREHLDNLGMYLYHAHVPLNARPIKLEPMMTKIRYDGDRGLDIRQDLREAYNHSISFGTRNLRPAILLDVLDEIRFINKSEVGEFIPQHPDISHAGSDLIDFAAIYIARAMWGEEYKARRVAQVHKPTEQRIKDIESDLQAMCLIEVEGKKALDPYTIIGPMVFNSGFPQLTGLRRMSFFL